MGAAAGGDADDHRLPLRCNARAAGDGVSAMPHRDADTASSQLLVQARQVQPERGWCCGERPAVIVRLQTVEELEVGGGVVPGGGVVVVVGFAGS